MEKPVAIRSEIQRLLDQFTRGTIDFQALLGALDQTFLADPSGRRIALELIDKQNPNGALQRSFFRVLKERIEQQLATGSPPPPRAPSGRGMPEWNRAAPSQQAASASRPARPFGSRLRARDERAQSEATRPFEQSSPQEKDERTPYDMTLPFPPPRVRDDHPSAEVTRPLVPPESPRREMSPAEARAAFRPPPPERDEPATAEATRPLALEPSSDALSREESTSTPTPAAVPDEPAPSETKEAVTPPPVEERPAGRRRSSFTRGRYANRWAQRQEPKEPASPPATARSEPAAPPDLDAAAAPDLDTAAATRPPDFDVGTPIAEGAGTTDFASAASGADAALTRPPDEIMPPRSETPAPAPRRETHASESAHASPEPPAAEEPAMTVGEPAEPVRSEPPPRSPFLRRREPPPREHPFVTEYRPITPPRPQPLAWIGGVLILLLLFALMLLGPLKEFVPGFAAYVQREIPAASRALAPAPDQADEESVPPAAVAPSSAPPAATKDAVPDEAPVEPTAPASSAGDGGAKPGAAATTSPSKTGPGSTSTAAPSANASGAAKPATTGTGVPPTTKAPAPVASSTTKAPAPATSSTPKAPSPGTAAVPAKSAPAKTASASIPAPVSAPAGRFAFASRSYSGRESGGMVAIRIVRRGGAAGTAYVTWTTRPDSAAPGDDYADFGPRMESFADGERERVIYVPIANDDMAEPRESFAVQLEDPSDGATLDGTSSTTVTILDDDS